MILADLNAALQYGLICALVDGVIGALAGAIRWLAMGGRKRGTASDYVGWLKTSKSPKDEVKK